MAVNWPSWMYPKSEEQKKEDRKIFWQAMAMVAVFMGIVIYLYHASGCAAETVKLQEEQQLKIDKAEFERLKKKFEKEN